MGVKATNENILSLVRTGLRGELENSLPPIAQGNMSKIYDKLMEYAGGSNDIIRELIRRIGLQTVDSTAWRNPLARFKKDPIRYGSSYEESFINMCKAHDYNPKGDYKQAFQQYESYLMTAWHNVNLFLQYPVTVTYDNMRNAFLSETGIRDLMSAKMTSVMTGAEWSEYKVMRDLLTDGYKKKFLPAVHSEKVVDQSSANKLLAQIKTAIGEFSFPNPLNNPAGATSTSTPQNLIWITTPAVNANISVESLAYAFNMDKADVEVNTVLVDTFGNDKIQGMLVDIRFFQVRDHFRQLTDQMLATILAWNFFYTIAEMISPSPFYPVRVFTTEDVSTSGQSIECTETKYSAGSVKDIVASATGTGYVAQLLDYEIVSGATSEDTYILAGTNRLYTGSDETGTIKIKITLRGTSASKEITLMKEG